MSKQKTPLQLRYAERVEQNARIAEALARQRQIERNTTGHVKRPNSNELLRYLNPKIGRGNVLRSPDEFRSLTYNLGRRITEFVNYLFVQYPVPLFLYRSVLTEEGWRQVAPNTSRTSPCSAWERDAFFAAAQGRSVADVMKDRLTRKETHWFLNAPETQTARQNIVWAKLVTAGADANDATFLVQRLRAGDLVQCIGARIVEIGQFFGQFGPQMDPITKTTIVDYLMAAYRDRTFTLKGRTLGSVIELSRRWHATDIAGSTVPYMAWRSTFGLWEVSSGQELVRCVELTNTRALAEEGRQQRHCVYMYADSCRSGFLCIVSLRWLVRNEDDNVKIVKRLTIEVSREDRAVCQVRGACNRMPNEDEIKMLRRWMGDHGVSLRYL